MNSRSSPTSAIKRLVRSLCDLLPRHQGSLYLELLYTVASTSGSLGKDVETSKVSVEGELATEIVCGVGADSVVEGIQSLEDS